MAKSIIEIQELVKDYGDTRAVDHLKLEIKKGEVFGLLGPNGAGKTTAILTLIGLSEPTAGSVTVKGYDATSQPLKVKKKVGYLPDDVGFSDNRTGLESLIYTAMLNRIPREQATRSARNLLSLVGLGAVADHQTKTYSKGMIQRLGLADVLIKDPEIIVLDEPTIGIDPKGINEFLELIRTLSKEKGITVLLCSHLLHQVQKICDRVGILVAGKLQAMGTVDELAEDLFGGKATTITAEVNPLTEKLIDSLKKQTYIKAIDIDDDELIIQAAKDAAPLISEQIIHNNGKLFHLSSKEFGLDEIYQHYFKEGAAHV